MRTGIIPLYLRYLFNIVKLNKCLKAKREKMIVLKELNTEAEMRKSYGTHITEVLIFSQNISV